MDDVLTYALYPTTGLRFLRIKYGLDPVPDEMKPPPAEAAAQGPAAAVEPEPAAPAPPKSARARAFNVYVGGDFYRVEVDPVGPPDRATRVTGAGGQGAPGASAGPQDGARPAAPGAAPDESTVAAPMPGLVLRYPVKVGQSVEAGDTVVILEAMKMENSLPSPAAGSIKALPFEPGATVAKGDVLAIIAP
jgi:biotin carboxyl carrier protein